ncbi:MAG: ribonuclease N1 [Flavobacteriales bacterium]|nr:MAG: ribonuclease N1 [Flavobacteriales bacterium]
MKKDQKIIKILLAVLVIVGGYFFFKNFTINHELPAQDHLIKNQSSKQIHTSIDKLTEEKKVIAYVKKNHHLPDYYLTKNEARKLGWKPHLGNLCEVLPNRAIGGDSFGNRERKLPKGNRYFEADVNYQCGNRNADRIIFTQKGEVWLTHDHYKTFTKQ